MGHRGLDALLGLSVLCLVLSTLPGALAGTADAPEVTDASDDRVLATVVPLGSIPVPVAEAAELVAGWVSENSTALFFNIEVAGDIAAGLAAEPVGVTAEYDFEFHFTRAGEDLHAAVAIADEVVGDGVTPGELATAATVSGAVVNLTVLKSALPGLAPGENLSALEITAVATLTAVTEFGTVTDEAASTTAYAVQLADGGVAGDIDADGLPDAWEQENFGGLAGNGTTDADGDGLNNTAENQLGTDPADEDTDGDTVLDGADPFPLDPTRPSDVDGDGLPDAWEREHFTTTAAQAGSGDPDADGLNNTRENALGTDPNVADTDGDGFDDANDATPLEPNQPASTDADTGADRDELRYGVVLFAAASTFILLGLARGI